MARQLISFGTRSRGEFERAAKGSYSFSAAVKVRRRCKHSSRGGSSAAAPRREECRPARALRPHPRRSFDPPRLFPPLPTVTPQEIHAAAAPPPAGVIFRVAAVSSIPFIGFGFCDNSIMARLLLCSRNNAIYPSISCLARLRPRRWRGSHQAVRRPDALLVRRSQILSGDAIQDFGGAALGLSVMAAAGLGNMARWPPAGACRACVGPPSLLNHA